MTKTLAPIALTCGDPAGIGLELAQKAWEALKGDVCFALIADPRHLAGDVPHNVLSDIGEAHSAALSALPVLPLTFGGDATPGRADPRNAQGVIDAIETAVSLTQSGQASAICTAPINKKALKDGAGFGFPGHTEFLAHLAGVDDVVMIVRLSRNIGIVSLRYCIIVKLYYCNYFTIIQFHNTK